MVDSGGTHADLTEDYASVPSDMKSIARALGKDVCREISMDDLISNMGKMRLEAGDRALLRALRRFAKERIS